MTALLEWAISISVIIGALFMFIGSLGMARLPDFHMRLHGPTKASTLGVGAVLIASMMYFSPSEPGWSISELLVAIFMLITAPVSAHLLSKAGMHGKLPRVERTRGEPWEQ